MVRKAKPPSKAQQSQISDAEWDKIRKFGQNVRQERLNRGWTLEQMEQRGYKSWKHWQDIEAGNRNISFTTIVRIAKALRVSPQDLLKGI